MQHPEDIPCGQDDAQNRQNRQRREGAERAEEYQDLGYEPAQQRQPERCRARDQEGSGEHRHPVRQAAQVGDVPGVGLLIHDAHGDEEQPGDGTVGEQLHGGAGEAGVGQGSAHHRDGTEPNQHQPHVADAGIRDESFQVGLPHGDHRAVKHADDPQGHDGQGELLKLLGEHAGVDAQQSVAAHLQHHAGQHHAAGGGRVGVSVGQPRVDGPGGAA